VLQPRGQFQAGGQAQRASRQETARLSAAWRVVRLWDLRADDPFAAGDMGPVPWVPLTRSSFRSRARAGARARRG
jgi:hypothetical protein